MKFVARSGRHGAAKNRQIPVLRDERDVFPVRAFIGRSAQRDAQQKRRAQNEMQRQRPPQNGVFLHGFLRFAH